MLAALRLGPGVPGERQRLQPSVGECDQILLQRIDAEGVFDLEQGELAVRPVGFDPKFAVAAKEARSHAVIVERHAGKIAQHRPLGRVSHGVAMLRCVPQIGFGRVALRTCFAADEGRRGRLAGLPSDLAALDRMESEAARAKIAAAAAAVIQILLLEENKRACERAAGEAPAGLLRGRLWPAVLRRLRVNVAARPARAAYSKAKMRFQSVFMLMTVQPFFVASSYSAGVKVPTLVSGRFCAGP